MTRLSLAFLFVSIVVFPALADQPWPYTWVVETAADDEVSLFMTPDGSGPPLAEARLFGGLVADATITAQLVTFDGDPYVGLPREDIWLQWRDAPGQVTGCVHADSYPGGMFLPDGDSDIDGMVTFSLPLRGGGWSDGPATLFLNGSPAQNLGGWQEGPVAIRVNSPDITGDRLVNLSDIVLVTQDLGAYAYRSDFNWDGAVNLTDITIFAQAIGVVCP